MNIVVVVALVRVLFKQTIIVSSGVFSSVAHQSQSHSANGLLRLCRGVEVEMSGLWHYQCTWFAHSWFVLSRRGSIELLRNELCGCVQ